MKFLRHFKAILIVVITLFIANNSYALLNLKVNSDTDLPRHKILFFGFDVDEARLDQDVKQIMSMIMKNLNSTNLFEIVAATNAMEVMLQDSSIYVNISDNDMEEQRKNAKINSDSIPNFEKYSEQNISAIIVGDFKYDEVGNLEAKIRAWDVLDQKQLFGRFYNASEDNYNKIANYVSNEIFIKLTGEKIGHFDSKITYVAESGSLSNRLKRLALIDFNGSNQKFLSDGSELVLTPTFSRNHDEIFYLRYFLDKPHIFKINLNNGRSNKVTGFRQTNFSPAPHPTDSSKILLSAIVDQNTDIYEYDMITNTSTRITNDQSIDTTPSYSPDGSKIVFTSDRDGKQQIYLINYNDYSLRQIGNPDNAYSKPQWSPDGKYIAFTKFKNNEFYAGIILPDGSNEKILAKGYVLEGVKWSPSSRYLIYSKKRGPYGPESIPRLFTVDIITGFEYEIPTPNGEGAIDPDWVS